MLQCFQNPLAALQQGIFVLLPLRCNGKFLPSTSPNHTSSSQSPSPNQLKPTSNQAKDLAGSLGYSSSHLNLLTQLPFKLRPISLCSLWFSSVCYTIPAPYLLCNPEQHCPKTNTMNSILRREIRPPSKGLEVWGQPDTHGPTTSTTGGL